MRKRLRSGCAERTNYVTHTDSYNNITVLTIKQTAKQTDEMKRGESNRVTTVLVATFRKLATHTHTHTHTHKRTNTQTKKTIT